MNEAIAALISLVTAIVAAVVTTSWRMRAERRQKREDQLEALLSQYREPLAAAFELQSRPYNIVLMHFLETYLDSERGYVVGSTQWLVGAVPGVDGDPSPQGPIPRPGLRSHLDT
jgi:hypothetical protein